MTESTAIVRAAEARAEQAFATWEPKFNGAEAPIAHLRRVASIIGDLTGQFIEQTLTPDILPRHTAHMIDVTENLAVRYLIADLAWLDRPHIRFHRLLLPLSDDQKRANILLGIAYYVGVGEKRQGEAPGESRVPGRAFSMTELVDARLVADEIPVA